MSEQHQLKPWEQQEGEPSESYARFLVYRNLGMARTQRKAYAAANGRQAGKCPSGKWQDDSARWNWVERAAAWDIAQLVHTVPAATTAIFKVIDETARACLADLEDGKLKPRNFRELLETVSFLASLISPEVISAIIENTAHPADAPGMGV